MIVNLKQHEIEAALRQYIAQQGININSKSVTISFTAGRKETGISAELDIEDMEFSDMEFSEPETPVFIPQISVVVPTGLINREIEAAEAELVSVPMETTAHTSSGVINEGVVKTTSLFG